MGHQDDLSSHVHFKTEFTRHSLSRGFFFRPSSDPSSPGPLVLVGRAGVALALLPLLLPLLFLPPSMDDMMSMSFLRRAAHADGPSPRRAASRVGGAAAASGGGIAARARRLHRGAPFGADPGERLRAREQLVVAAVVVAQPRRPQRARPLRSTRPRYDGLVGAAGSAADVVKVDDDGRRRPSAAAPSRSSRRPRRRRARTPSTSPRGTPCATAGASSGCRSPRDAAASRACGVPRVVHAYCARARRRARPAAAAR